MNAKDSEVASSHLIDTSLLPIFGHKAFIHLPRFNWKGAPLTEKFLVYPEIPKNYSICIET